MPWPSKITRAFATVEERVGISPLENQYYGPYNKLLHTLFPPDSDFIVSPNYLPGNTEGGADFVVSFEITLRQHPVLIIEIKQPRIMEFNSARKQADEQIRNRLFDLLERTPLRSLYGISAIGTRLCFYEFQKVPRRLTPRRIPSDPELMIDVTPQEQWDCDVLEADGEQRLRVLATHITEACESLQA